MLYSINAPRIDRPLIKAHSNHAAPSPPIQRRSAAGFSLVEVALALGIIAFAFVPIFGMLPVGMSASRAAVDATLEAQIMQRMSGMVVQADFSNLQSLGNSGDRFFDYQGNPMTEERDAIYRVDLEISTSTSLPNSGDTARLATVAIRILNLTAPGSDSNSRSQANEGASKHVVLIADNGR